MGRIRPILLLVLIILLKKMKMFFFCFFTPGKPRPTEWRYRGISICILWCWCHICQIYLFLRDWKYIFQSFTTITTSLFAKPLSEMNGVAFLQCNIHILSQMLLHNYQIIGLSAQGNKKPPSNPWRPWLMFFLTFWFQFSPSLSNPHCIITLQLGATWQSGSTTGYKPSPLQ